MSDFFDMYFEYFKNTESPMIYHRWCAMSGIAALLGRQFYMQHGHTDIYPNMYCMLIGDPGARKSSAVKGIKRLLLQAGYSTVAADKTTKEKFLLDMEEQGADTASTPRAANSTLAELFGKEGTGSDNKEMFIMADEFNDFMGINNIEFISLLTNLWDYDGPYRSRIKTGKSVSINNPTINMLTGNTHAGFNEALPPSIVGQGFLSRLILIYGEKGKKITFPARPPEELTTELVTALGVIKEHVQGRAEIEPAALTAIDYIYQNWEDLEDLRFRSYSTRRLTHLLKLCLLCAAMRVSTTITLSDLVLANTILTYTESMMPKALGEFGKAKHSSAASKIMAALYEAHKPLVIQDLWKVCSTDIEFKELAGLITGLVQADKIQSTDKGFLAKVRHLDKEVKYVDYSLLKEIEHGRY